MRIYKAGKLTGQTVNGKFVPLPPAPGGDAFDDLWNECCKAVGLSSRLKGRTEFAPTVDKTSGQIVQHSWKLGEEVARWIREGNLRSHVQVNEAITTFADHWDRFVRLGVIPSWKLEWGNLTYLRGFFGLADGKPLPSKQEFLDEKAAWEANESERLRQVNIARREENKIRAEYEAELEKRDRVERLTKQVAAKLYSFDKIDLSEEPLPPEYRDLSQRRKLFRVVATDEIKSRIEQGKTDDEIQEEMIMQLLEALTEVGESEIPPLETGQTRRFFTYDELMKFIKGGEWERVLDVSDTVLMKGLDGLFVMDTAPKAIDQPAGTQELDASEISEEADNGVILA